MVVMPEASSQGGWGISPPPSPLIRGLFLGPAVAICGLEVGGLLKSLFLRTPGPSVLVVPRTLHIHQPGA